jgi:hypothetical protein
VHKGTLCPRRGPVSPFGAQLLALGRGLYNILAQIFPGFDWRRHPTDRIVRNHIWSGRERTARNRRFRHHSPAHGARPICDSTTPPKLARLLVRKAPAIVFNAYTDEVAPHMSSSRAYGDFSCAEQLTSACTRRRVAAPRPQGVAQGVAIDIGISANPWSEWQDLWQDLNLRPPRPERGALPDGGS